MSTLHQEPARQEFTPADYRCIVSGTAELMNDRLLHRAIKSAIAAVDEERWGIRIPPGHPFWHVYETYAENVVEALRQASPLQSQPAP